MFRFFSALICLLIPEILISQNIISVNANFDIEKRSITIEQTIQYYNTSSSTLNSIYLNDWNNSYSSKDTPLAERFAEEYKNTFHFAKNVDRGFTEITNISQDNSKVSYERLKNHSDIIKVDLATPILPNTAYNLKLNYTIRVADNKFTRYGITKKNELDLRYWYITPAVYDGKWHYYSNKDLNDLYVPKADLNLNLTYPKNYSVISELEEDNTITTNTTKQTTLVGKASVTTKLSLLKKNNYKTVETDFFSIITNINNENLPPHDTAIAADNVVGFIHNEFGDYPHETLLLSDIDYKKSPIYGINQLPEFIRPFTKEFQYELKILKTALNNYLENTLLINPRKDQWVLEGIQTYYLMKYVDVHYPEMKILGAISNFWGVRAFHASDLKFNDQYNFLYLHMARSGLDQPLSMSKDSLIKFNKNISNKYKAGTGLNYLNSYVGHEKIAQSISLYVKENKLKPTSSAVFESYLKKASDKPIDWFFNEYIGTNKKIDYKIKKIKRDKDSLTVTLLNKRDNTMPITLFGLRKGKTVFETWVEGFTDKKTIRLAKKDADHLRINHDQIAPEFNLRNNSKSIKGLRLLNKPLQFRLFKDVEDPNYSQVFFMPEADYNFYDGFSPGLKLYNKTILSKNLLYRISPKYGVKSGDLVGSASIIYNHRTDNKNNFRTRYGIGGSFFNYAPNLRYSSYTPFISFRYRNKDDYRNNKRQFLSFRYVNINREVDPNRESLTSGEPKYSVFNAKFGISNPNLKHFSSWFNDFQLAGDFGKVSTTMEFRKLTEKNRQYNLRIYAGSFLYNKTFQDSNFFSFALDRPTDYLFDYDYLGRSEETGLLSQQLIIAEGGFKSRLNTPFINQWLTTANTSTTLWRYIMAYGDIGFIKNRGTKPEFVYDSGIRLNLVEDYFELYFPVYSNLGWEISQPKYEEKIRFIVTLSPRTLLGLFTRRWY